MSLDKEKNLDVDFNALVSLTKKVEDSSPVAYLKGENIKDMKSFLKFFKLEAGLTIFMLFLGTAAFFRDGSMFNTNISLVSGIFMTVYCLLLILSFNILSSETRIKAELFQKTYGYALKKQEQIGKRFGIKGSILHMTYSVGLITSIFSLFPR